MSEIDPLGARLAIQNAQFALQKKQFVEARRLAMEAAQLDPDFEDPWLILATLSSPKASVAYLQKALEINPHSARATKGMQWALERLATSNDREEVNRHQTAPLRPPEQAQASLPATQPVAVVPPVVEDTQPTVPQRPAGELVTDADIYAAFKVQEEKSHEDTQPLRVKGGGAGKPPAGRAAAASAAKPTHRASGFLIFTLVLIGLLAVLWLALPSWAALANSASTDLPADVLAKPSLTPTNTATVTPSPTPTETPTPLPTATPLPTDTPWPTATAVSYAPTADTSYSSYVQPTLSADTSGRWIDVDLTNQMLYAYEGSTVVASFLVSTGVAAYPTVTGQYYIYVKYVSTLMTGPGYYLPDVPYTMYFYQGYGIHGTYWHNNFGTPMSHGCVNMRTSDAEWMFNWASVGTLVNIHY
jgi:lipoprotein-anchoring transpeptidase ErfK/SrfK